MSVVQVKKALQDFAVKGKGAAVVLKGDWGTGKTYLWDSILKEEGATFLRAHYSYVSLFGINSLIDLKRSIFENTVPSAKVGSENSVLDNLKRLDFSDGAGWLKKALRQGKEAKIPFIGSLGGVVDSIQYSMISNTLICIDDFERRGNSLSARDVLGLISNLIEKKNCSVILILNDGSLKPDDDFFSYNEKVFDYEVMFKPSVQESVSLVFDQDDETSRLLSLNVIDLEINNVRLLKRINYFSGVLRERLNSGQEKIRVQACRTLPLAVLSMYGGKSAVVDIEFLLRYGGWSLRYDMSDDRASQEELEARAEKESKIEYLRSYGFLACDEFDVAIINLVRRGYVDDEALQSLIQMLTDKIQHEKDVALLQEAWNVFHASFSDNANEVLAVFDRAIEKALLKFSINDLDSVASVYYEMGEVESIKLAVDKYFDEVISLGDIRGKGEIYRWPQNSYIQEKLDFYFDGFLVEKSFPELMQQAYSVSGFNSAEVRSGLAKKTEEEFLQFFSSFNDCNFTDYVRMCLKCGQIQSPDKEIHDSYRQIFFKTYKSLIKISESSPLNKARMSKFKDYENLYELAVKEMK